MYLRRDPLPDSPDQGGAKICMDTLSSFLFHLQENDVMMSFDIKSGYHQMFLHPAMRDYFIFHYGGRFSLLGPPLWLGSIMLLFQSINATIHTVHEGDP